MINYHIRKYKSNDKEQIYQLIREIWGEDKAEKSKKHWDWQFESNPANPPDGPNILVLEQDNRIVGLFSGLPVSIKVKDKVLTALWTVDFMTLPKHRGRGVRLLKQMMKEPYILLGNPNDNSYPLGKRLGWFDICQPPTLINIINMANILKTKPRNRIVIGLGGIVWKLASMMLSMSKGISQGGDISVKRISIFDEEIDRFWKKVSRDYGVIVVRDRKYLNWRFVDCPDEKYAIYIARRNGKISGYIILRNEDKGGLKYGYIVDILTMSDDKELLQYLIQKAVELFKIKGVDLITCLISPCNRVHLGILKRNGFFFKEYITKFMGYTNSLQLPEKDLKNPCNWFISRGDSDIDLI